MPAWLAQLISLIASETGSLVYHLVLGFTLILTLNHAVSLNAPAVSARRRRTVIGLGLLLAMQFGLFLISVLHWQVLIDAGQILPPLDRFVSLASLLVIVWMWSFPDPAPLGDAATLLLGITIVVGTVAATVWWAGQGPPLYYNGTPWDRAAAVFGIALAFLGAIYLLVVRPDGSGYALAMLLVLAAGFAFHLVLAPYGNDYPSVLRLAQMAAYPLLGLLSSRLASPSLPVSASAGLETSNSPGSSTLSLGERAAVRLPPAVLAASDPAIWQTLARLAADNDPQRLAREVAVTLAQAFDADVCALLVPPDAGGNFPVQFAYDRRNRRFIDARVMEGRSLPVIASAWRMGRNRRLAANSSTPDLATVAATFGLESVNSLLFQPVLAADGKPGTSILLLSLDADKDWTPAEQEFLALLARLLVQFLQRSQAMAILKDDLLQSRQLSRQAQDQVQAAFDEHQKLAGQLAVLREDAERDAQEINRLTAIQAAHEIAQQALADLHQETEHLKETARQAGKAFAEREQTRNGELRMALQEIALLNDSLREAEQKITALKMDQVDTSPSRTQFETIASIGKDLRQPLASVGGYADVLLGETMGILGGKQRKFIERIKVSTERMSRLLDELIQATAPESNSGRLEFELLDLRDLVQRAAVDAEHTLARRRSALRLDFPSASLQIYTDRHAFKMIVAQFLENAAQASPEGGLITVRGRLQGSEGDQDYALLQFIDTGPGISPDDLVRVFAPALEPVSVTPPGTGPLNPSALVPGPRTPDSSTLNSSTPNSLFPGLGVSPSALARLKTLVEAIGGRTWVDSDAGHGATFSMLLPVAAPDGERQPAASNRVADLSSTEGRIAGNGRKEAE